MRFYDIQVYNSGFGNSPGTLYRRWTSLNADGSFNPCAPEVGFDIPITALGSPGSGSHITIYGVALSDIQQAKNFNGKQIKMFGGMSKGLPLANPAQRGLLFEGYIWQAYGNWIGTSQSLEFIVLPGAGLSNSIANFSFNWKAGTPLSQALQQTLRNAFPGYTVNTANVNPSIVAATDQQGIYLTLPAFAEYINSLTKNTTFQSSTVKSTTPGLNYQGVQIYFSGNTIICQDQNFGATVKKIDFTDLIGQPTWFGPNTIQFNSVMRGDLTWGMTVQLPPTIYTYTPTSLASLRQSPVFNGQGIIAGGDAFLRHVGQFRAPDAASWITTVNLTIIAT